MGDSGIVLLDSGNADDLMRNAANQYAISSAGTAATSAAATVSRLSPDWIRSFTSRTLTSSSTPRTRCQM
jgi:hypothetical protein